MSKRLPSAAWSAVALWAVVIFYLSSLTGREIARLSPFDLWDKLTHFLAFAVGGLLLATALRWSVAWPWKKLTIFAIVAISLYGVADEIHQLFTPFRSGGDFGDWLADSLGGGAGVILFRYLHARSQHARRPSPSGA